MSMSRPKIMGILNVTPDSFSDGGHYNADIEQAVEHALGLIDAGADMIDIGGESTRPGADEIAVKDEIKRTVPVITALRAATRDFDHDPVISIDTRKPDVAMAAIYAGADIWNDVSALSFDPRSADIAADLSCPVILMHARGLPDTMQDDPHYMDPVREICTELEHHIARAVAAGVDASHITLDPGIGFGKRLEDNLAVMRELKTLHALGYPILLGASRKSFIGKIDGSVVSDRLGGSIAAALWAMQCGVDILRVHDVSETVQAVKVWESISNG